jgi:hypothetical protein
MERFVLSPRFPNHFGMALAIVIFVAIVVFDAPGWTFVPISMAGLSLLAKLRFWAERDLNDR